MEVSVAFLIHRGCSLSSSFSWLQHKCVISYHFPVNDAPALALADVSVAVGTGAALATKTSDVILTDSNLNKLFDSIIIGRRAARTILQNITISLVSKGVVVGLTAFGITSLWAAIASDVGTMLIVTTNGLRILSSRKRSNSIKTETSCAYVSLYLME